MFSELMDKMRKGRDVGPKRTICEVHREVYDILVIELATTRPDVIERIVPLLEDAFIMGVKLNKALVEHKLSQDFTAEATDVKAAVAQRRQRRRLIRMLEQNNQILTEHAKPKGVPV